MKSLTLPGSKSLTIRDFILATLATGKSLLNGVLISDDTKYLLDALKILGISIENIGNQYIINGGIGNINGNHQTLFLGNSGTSVRLLIGLAILNQQGTITITGNEDMLKRPVNDLIDGITQLGIEVISNNGCLPITIKPSKISHNYIKMRGDISSQFFTSLIQVAPLLPNGLEIEVLGDLVSKPYIDLTINEMHKFGVSVLNRNYQFFEISPQIYHPTNLIIEGDASALSYWAAYLVLHGGQLQITNIGSNTQQGDYGFLKILQKFGLNYKSNGIETILEAPGIKNIDLSTYQNITEDFKNMPDISMTFMILALFLPGITVVTGVETLNLKECRRLDAMYTELKKLHIYLEASDNLIKIGELQEFPSTITNIDTYHDHRIAMSFGILNTYIGNLQIENPACVSKTYPNFWEELNSMQTIL